MTRLRDLPPGNNRLVCDKPPRGESEVFRHLRKQEGKADCPTGCGQSFNRGDTLLVHLSKEHSTVLDRFCSTCQDSDESDEPAYCRACCALRTDPLLVAGLVADSSSRFSSGTLYGARTPPPSSSTKRLFGNFTNQEEAHMARELALLHRERIWRLSSLKTQPPPPCRQPRPLQLQLQQQQQLLHEQQQQQQQQQQLPSQL